MAAEVAVARETKARAIRAMTVVEAEAPKEKVVAKEPAARGRHRADMQLSGVGPTPTHALDAFLGGSAGKSKGAAAMAGQHRSK